LREELSDAALGVLLLQCLCCSSSVAVPLLQCLCCSASVAVPLLKCTISFVIQSCSWAARGARWHNLFVGVLSLCFIAIYTYIFAESLAVRTVVSIINVSHLLILQHTATHCNTLQHTATHCNTLQHTATHCNTQLHHHMTP